MAITVAVSKPAGGRVDDVRALRFRVRTLTLSGTYATGGVSIPASSFGLKRVIGVIPFGLAPASALTTAEAVHFVPSASGAAVTMLQYESAAAASPLGEVNNTQAVITGQAVTVLVIGY
jgi:hypothetical protein